jgi:glucose/arabinose dehydrogenase
MQISIAPDGRVFFIERDGNCVEMFLLSHFHIIIYFNLIVFTKRWCDVDGLLGLALDPNFSSNQWVYLYYSPNGVVAENILSRFTMKGDFLDKTSEKILLRIPTQRQECCHSR